jgi:hypothetical protein
VIARCPLEDSNLRKPGRSTIGDALSCVVAPGAAPKLAHSAELYSDRDGAACVEHSFARVGFCATPAESSWYREDAHEPATAGLTATANVLKTFAFAVAASAPRTTTASCDRQLEARLLASPSPLPGLKRPWASTSSPHLPRRT